MARHQFTPPCGFDLQTTTITGHEISAIHFWGYRLVLHPDGSHFVHEAYYGVDEGLLGIASVPARPCGDTPEEVREELHLMEEALTEPTLALLAFSANGKAGGSGPGGSLLN